MKTLTRSASLENKEAIAGASPIKVCMHVLERACTDGRVMRAATALKDAGFAVFIVDIEIECTQKGLKLSLSKRRV